MASGWEAWNNIVKAGPLDEFRIELYFKKEILSMLIPAGSTMVEIKEWNYSDPGGITLHKIK